ncbi:2Fe-2S iron-sulfur cluster-binding protein [Ramlibacter pallidus]|uniref:2Fe-2S iron-sulfur cluster binding domain-containing protein n=1 Tax=Ramlibacter pallidus TaxID=2780087 RepID=A0ABR9S4T6_9BURK|nr:2Fe-2S iron-sulfur cluster-binding protein [Ramlibacter pallidus]MBE7368526.1 2Fe-2S iron-sulfur cluster binding domain-containing protein [Ramlibacter pallidus]
MTEKGPDDGPFRVTVRPAGTTFEADAGRTLLASALLAGVEGLPNSCRNGTCRACLQPLHRGEVAYRIPWPGLLPEERTGGWVLPCVAFPRSDIELGG